LPLDSVPTQVRVTVACPCTNPVFGLTSTGVPGPALLSSTTQQNSAKIPAPVISPQPRQTHQAPRSNYDAFQPLGGSRPSSKPATPVPAIHQQKQPAQHSASHDPFAALVSPSPRASTPSQPHTNYPAPQSATLLDLAQPAPQSNVQGPSTTVDDEWTFTSALPELPNQTTLSILNSSISISFTAHRHPQTGSIEIVATFSNNTPQSISDVHFQVAIEKVQ
jgi:ADP-ribosylation factor-binding protein GGA